MKTILKRFVAGAVLTILASAFSGCSPMVVAPSHPRPVVYTPVPPPAPIPVQQVVVAPIVPVWAPPYTYVTEVHYYYFPDYMVYYDIFNQQYCYYNGFSWLHVVVLPSLPLYYGFNPYNTYIVVLNHSVYQPWVRHDYYEQQYPTGYYKTMYSPRTALGSNTILRAYDENQSRPVFVDKRSNKEVAVKYDVRQTRVDVKENSTKINSTRTQPQTITSGSDRHETINGPADRKTVKNSTVPETRNGNAPQHNTSLNNPADKMIKRNDSREANVNQIKKNQPELPSGVKTTSRSDNRNSDSKPAKVDGKSKETKMNVESGNGSNISATKNKSNEKLNSHRSK